MVIHPQEPYFLELDDGIKVVREEYEQGDYVGINGDYKYTWIDSVHRYIYDFFVRRGW